ncbi:probable phosphopantothenoylcysteine decarboxylase [uncultured Caudovirales phage]|uniref:Probable phosphopantothenoylcysteine decarboxylase n=1 Tax=uncultured Caudovirales phage TaxID=2100421 RepID=A0A6J5RIP7_9CAUD|nr:probable phosphopantothenoylcysteine decarboxylase [uncultured Caudovirales phage]
MNILLGVTGSVAAIKAPKLITALREIGTVKIAPTESALKFNSLNESYLDLYTDKDEWEWKKIGDSVIHIELRDWFDVFVIAPLTAKTMAKMSHGICDNLLTTIWMASPGKKVLVAPAMNTQMWNHPITIKNVISLMDLGVKFVSPIEKKLACGETGIGAMAEIKDIVSMTKLLIS